MKRFYVVAATVFLTIFLVVAVNAAPTSTPGTADVPQGLKNAKKVMQARVARDKRMHQMQEKAQVDKMKAQRRK